MKDKEATWGCLGVEEGDVTTFTLYPNTKMVRSEDGWGIVKDKGTKKYI